jgi:single-stranded-DNA-specific exonuclease
MTQDAAAQTQSARGRRWTVAPETSGGDRLARACGLPSLVGRLLAARGWTDPEAVRAYLQPRLSDLSDPFKLPAMEPAVARIRRALARGEPIAVFGDYDVDGVTATALLVQVLERLGGRAAPFLPNRLTDGYGLGCEPLARCIDASGAGLVISVDCGTGSAEAVALAAARGVDVVVTDHHALSGDPAPAVAVVNPHCGTDEDLRALAGVGVAFKLCHALVKAGLEAGEDTARGLDLRDWLDCVAVGTVADVVPLTGENRILVRHGLERLACTESVGLRALCRVAAAQPPFTGYHVGYLLGPRLNAAGRMGSARDALDLLLTRNAGHAEELAQALDAANTKRRRIEAEMLQAARAQVDAGFDPARDFGLVAGRTGWHIGTAGIVAGRLVSVFHRPTVVVALEEDGAGRGSCRGIEGVDLIRALEACRDELETFGGHRMAAGVTLRRGRLEAFRERFNAACAAQMDGCVLGPVLHVDGWTALGELNVESAEALNPLRPFGVGNPEPLWGVRDVRVAGMPRVVGKDHLKFAVASGETVVDAIAFGMGACALPDGPLDVVFHLRENTFGGRCRAQLNVRDFRPSRTR